MTLTTEQKRDLLMKAMREETFRAALLEDATAAAREELGLTPPPEYRLHALPYGADEIVLVVPPYPESCPADAPVDTLREHLRQGWQGLQAVDASQQHAMDGQATLIAKAWHDPTYKQALLQDPRAVAEREFGAALPDDVTLRAVAEDADTQYLALPPALSDMELSDEQLEQVAGGEIAVTLTLFVGIPLATVGTVAGVTAGVVLGKHAGW